MKIASRIALAYQIEYANTWIKANILINKIDDRLLILGSHFNHIPDSVEKQNSFTLRNKRPSHYIFVLMMLATFSFVCYTIILCIRTKHLKYKWLWIILILFEIGKVSFNWRSAEFETKLLFWRIGIPPGFEASKASPYDPWILAFSIPIGAISFLLMRKRLQADNSTAGN